MRWTPGSITAVKFRNDAAFDYGVLPVSVQKAVREQTESILGLLSKSTANIIQIGLRLQFVRDRHGRECFQPWLAAEFQWSQTTASNYMRAARSFRDIDCLDRLLPSALFVHARKNVPAAARAEAIHLARCGERITKRKATEIVERYVSAEPQTHPVTQRVRRYFLHALKQLSPEQIESLIVELSEMAEELRRPETGR